ncbi:MAG: flavodoxin [Gammaproteobacteria bacterium]|nr:MAG: flavodoxin [Gammaproteobacteria bacterium]
MSEKKLTIGIVYFSNTGYTAQLAQAISQGAQQATTTNIVEYQIGADDMVGGRFSNNQLFEQLSDCDAIAFGSPTYMGSVSAPMKAFMDSSSPVWERQLWADKLAIGFTSGAGLNGEQTCTLQTLFAFACQHGMLWLSVDKHNLCEDKLNRMGCQIGIAACTIDGMHANDLKTAAYLGKRLAIFAQKLQQQTQ